ncbi:arabinosyltransferase domain-containing protein [Acinetobacter baumannii]|uniref:arabinosyltransferase domain-containing protein n=1 Tax=Acinetobacter baumannii TaxID=470 RepID=UPI00339D73D6
MALNPTKWTHHFGAFATIGAALAALVTMAVLPAATRSLRNRMMFLAAVFFILALSFTSTNGWWYISSTASRGAAPSRRSRASPCPPCSWC